MPVFQNFLGLGAAQHIDDMAGAEALAGAHGAGEKFLRRNGEINQLFLAGKAIVAHPARRLRERFAEIRQQRNTPAALAFRIAEQHAEMMVGDLALGSGFLIDKESDLRHIAVAQQQQAIRAQPVAAGAADFLIIRFKVFRQIIMNDEAHVRFVDPHAERNGGDDNLRVIAEKGFLILRALFVGQAGMIGPRRVAELLQHRGQLIHLLAREAINNAGLLRMLLQKFESLIDRIGFTRDTEKKILAIETRDELLRGREVEIRGNIGAHALRRRGRERDADGLRKARPAFHQLAILRPKVMAPFRNAMRFIDGETIDLERGEKRQRFDFQQSFGRHVKQLCLTLTDAVEIALILIGRQRAVQKHGGHAELLQLRHLVFHQRNQRRDHDGETLEQQRRQLIAQRFAAAGRHDDERVFFLQDVVDNFLLQRPELVVPKNFFENRFGAGEHGLTTKNDLVASRFNGRKYTYLFGEKQKKAPKFIRGFFATPSTEKTTAKRSSVSVA
ncbi:MAG: hypothetical protein ALAOOOJD_03365 [bacterium]|nr:hypothetical protein [bacterium]